MIEFLVVSWLVVIGWMTYFNGKKLDAITTVLKEIRDKQ